ncbi:ABC transporter ATP-binding protein [Pseudomonadales bacterium]|jgi:ABC-type dipeptide/oligopeptide/nickel transport system ATPase component|nr:ABC transporter ATP-binding protein [Gammaproteobacteria bacterium]MDA7725525.1 ABC transporter ATP-binding protein [Pseudomonadales bacterium]MBT7540929.1 ABC transporter ATP-binding protein [Gammaproteobacteria bacterium]MDA7772061.1 ABC transporter ATP-binding protein [Pseudomonadales bacterium]MDC1016864.1 ABC transporter ATP-binding protein [Pseudomonadales bacterium]|tara:strand:- start:9602 stop:10549 length:948 start_codon:yes stop_codon:yes gene_type:complete
MTNRNLVSIHDLHVTFDSELGTTEALKGIDLDIKHGRTTAIVGESGSGKSITALAMMRLIQRPGRVTSGQILFTPAGKETIDVLQIPDNSDELFDLRGGKMAMIFQEPMTALSPVHTIGDQVTEAILTHRQVTKAEAFSRACEMLKRVGINDAEQRMNQYPFEFSGGMRQRVVIAMALVCDPELLICDEPTTALDVTIQAEILALIRELKSALDTSVLFITHDLAVVAQLADDVVVMHRGRVLEVGTVRQILKRPIHPYTQALLAAIPTPATTGRLDTVAELLTEENLLPYPLVTIKDDQKVALPIDQIPEALRL